MTVTNVDAIYAEYPWLSRIVPRRRMLSMTIERWDEKFLLAYAHSYGGPERILLVDANGALVARVTYVNLGLFGWRETVGQRLSKIDDVEKRRIRYALWIWGETATLYKLPKGYGNVADWLSACIETDRAALRAD